ncbi:CsgE family curli-type amyloid fiber assembly protein [Aliiglaciecola sp. LCG003]|uniref:CsgE family curli-type amyloid fiber assembly protein n=1 Tax=Aliiglaciecola sp. LCG003 TaxID=3053655 RepID=UPI00257321AD|nr:CsgE family curli-type amyloid fiber assembly protein [Aliiglaciecola sp. LCG003]WJG10776.1 CsgE family curli-type amyloid fiber assembly protein [Aliiglaciecola sp. LCG003]
MRVKYKIIIWLFSYLLITPVHAEELVLSGLLLDNTISRQGHEFANQFGKYWREIPSSVGQNVQIKEIIVPKAGTKLSVHFDNRIVYQTYMGRRQTPIKQRVENAVVLLIEAISQADIELNNPDLADDEW